MEKAEELLKKYFDKVEIAGWILYDCKKCKEHGLSTKFATKKDALVHLVEFHGNGGIYQYFEDIRKIYGTKVLYEMTRNKT